MHFTATSIVTSICLFFSFSVIAQKSLTIEIQNKNGTIVNGNIDNLSYYEISSCSSYFNVTEQHEAELNFNNISQIEILDRGIFIPKLLTINGDLAYQLLHLLNDGEIKFYTLYTRIGEKYYLEDSKNKVRPLEVNISDKNGIRKTTYPFKRVLMESFKNDPSYSKKIEDIALSKNKISALIHDYNSSIGESRQYAGNKSKIAIDVAGSLKYMLGLSFENGELQSLSPTAIELGGYVVLHDPYLSRILSVHVGIEVSRSSYGNPGGTLNNTILYDMPGEYTLSNGEKLTLFENETFSEVISRSVPSHMVNQTTAVVPLFLRLYKSNSILSPIVDLGIVKEVYQQIQVNENIDKDFIPSVNMNDGYILNLGVALNLKPNYTVSISWSPIRKFQVMAYARF